VLQIKTEATVTRDSVKAIAKYQPTPTIPAMEKAITKAVRDKAPHIIGERLNIIPGLLLI